MTTRERHLAVVLVAVLGVFGLGFVAYQFVVSPLLDKNKQIEARKRDIAQLEGDILAVQVEKKKFEAARQQSLPADVGLAREQYGNLLEKICRRSELTNELKILQSDPDNKSVPMIAPKKPAYTKLTYKLTAKGELYHLVDFMRHFYQLPLLHTIKAMNIQRPSEARARDKRELDIDLTIEALVLDGAADRATLLPLVRELALLSGPAAQAGFNLQVVASGRGDPVPPTGVLAESAREYLAIPGKDVFFGPTPEKKKERDKREDDASKFVVLTEVTGREDGSCRAVFRDKLNNTDYVLTQDANGKLLVETQYEVNGSKKTLRKGLEIIYGSDETQNRRAWRVRRVCTSDSAVILERADRSEKPKPTPAAVFGGGPGAFVAVAEGDTYKVPVGHCLDPDSRTPPAPAKLLSREAWRAIFTPTGPPATTTVSTEDRGR